MLSPNPSSVLVSAVDVDKRHIVGLWLLDIAIQEPEITRAFQISLPIGDNVNEKVSMTSLIFGGGYMHIILCSMYYVNIISRELYMPWAYSPGVHLGHPP